MQKQTGEPMKKKIIMIVALLMIITTAVSASSLNGDYNGNPIVKLKSNGTLVDSGEVPAMIYDGKTMVPIAALRNLGADVTWDQNTYSVDIKLKQNSVQQSNFSISNALNESRKHGVDFIAMMSGTDGKTTIIYYYNGTSQQLFNKMDSFGAIFDNSITSDATSTEISFIDKETLSVSTDRIRDFKNGKITSQQLADEYRMEKPPIEPSNNIQQQQSQSQPPQESQNNVVNQQYICQVMHDDYILAKASFKEDHNPFSGSTQYDLEQFERQWKIKFDIAGCVKP